MAQIRSGFCSLHGKGAEVGTTEGVEFFRVIVGESLVRQVGGDSSQFCKNIDPPKALSRRGRTTKVRHNDPENLNETTVLMVRTLALTRYTNLMRVLRLKETVR